MKRNSVVMAKEPEMYRFYGRISRFIGKYHAEVIDCGRYRSIIALKDLEEVDYKGKWETRLIVRGEERLEFEYWNPMPTLRKLKQMSRCYDDFVWKKNRPKNLEEETWPNADRDHAGDAGAILLLYGEGK